MNVNMAGFRTFSDMTLKHSNYGTSPIERSNQFIVLINITWPTLTTFYFLLK
jgi:hypothetical protein